MHARIELFAVFGYLLSDKVSVQLETNIRFGEKRMTIEDLDRYRNNTWPVEYPQPYLTPQKGVLFSVPLLGDKHLHEMHSCSFQHPF